MSVVGFDLGNDSSVVAVARRRVIDILQNLQGARKTPTMVAFQGKQRLAGSDALAQFSNNFKNSLSLFKRMIGLKYDECKNEVNLEALPFKTVKLPNGTIGVEVTYDDQPTVLSMEQILAAMLQNLKEIAEAGLDGQRVVDCVLACPTYWTEDRRRRLLDAANIAGLNVLRLLNETAAVALTYGILRPLPENTQNHVMFIDVGHCDTKVGIAAFKQGQLRMLSSSADRTLGVDSFAELLVEHFANYIKEKYKMDVTTNKKAMVKLRKECVAVMKVLSANQKAPFNVEYIMNDKDVAGEITRAEFEEMAKEKLLGRLAMPIQEALALAGVKKEDLHSVEVVGGGVRIPMVQAALKDLVGKNLSFTCDGDESVARGCALMCAMISPSFKVREFEVVDLIAYDVDVSFGKAGDDLNTLVVEDTLPLVNVGNSIPTTKMMSFKERREPMQLDIKYRNPKLLPAGTDPLIGRYVIAGAPQQPHPHASKAPKLKVKIEVDLHGIVGIQSAIWVQELAEEVEEKVEPTPKASPAAADAKASPAAADAKAEPAADAAPMEAEEAAPTPEASPSAAESSPAAADAAGDAPAASEDAPAPMETEKEPEQKKKKIITKTTREALKVESHFSLSMTRAEINALFEKEAQMQNADRVIRETSDARNALESYVLEMRSSIRGELAEFIKQEDADKFCAKCDEEEEWLYEDGFDEQKSEYQKRLKALREQAEPARKRKDEATHRPEYVANLKKTLGHYTGLALGSDEKYAHIAAEEKKKVVDACAEADTWLAEVTGKQDKLTNAEDPAATCHEIEAKRKHIETLSDPILNKPKPKPKPEPKKEEPKKEDKKEENKNGDAPVDTSKDEFMEDAVPPLEETAPADATADAAAAATDAEAAAMDVETAN